MKIILGSRKHHYLAKVCIFLIMVTLIAGMVGCTSQYSILISSSTGGTVTHPGKRTFTYDAGTVVNLVATPYAGYSFVNWTGSVSTIADVNAASTNITMNGNYSITANFNGVLSFFDKHSYLPIVENATWTYSYNSTVRVTNVDTMHNTFTIENVGLFGSMDGIAGQDSKGKYISFSGFDSPQFLPVRYYFGFGLLLYENSKMTLGFNWEDSGYSGGYLCSNNLTVISTGINITTLGGQIYENCIVLQRDITYPNGYFWNPYLTKVLYYVKEGIGFVQEIKTWSDDSQEINYLTSYSIP